ncbi:MAG: hypothetical protein Q8P56_03890, partial [Candidatus Uhrbacteria bacterium]|nr:hypothetical protein [Candidatus Uhrbacteria bacterium]
MENKTEIKQCQNCKANFDIEPEPTHQIRRVNLLAHEFAHEQIHEQVKLGLGAGLRSVYTERYG